MKVVDITYKQYFELSDDEKQYYIHLLQYSNAGRTLKTKSFNELSFGFVKNVQSSMPLTFENFIELLSELEGASVVDYSLFALRSEMLYFVKEIDRINDIEKKLHHKATNEEQAAAVETLTSEFGALPQFLELAGGDPTKIEAVKQMQYSLAFACLLYNKELHEYRNRLNKIRQS